MPDLIRIRRGLSATHRARGLVVPKLVDREERRRNLAQAAARVVARVGLDGVTVQGVAAEAGYSAGSIAHYFRNKDELLAQALRAASEPLLQALQDSREQPHTLEDLKRIVRRSLPLDSNSETDWRVRLAFWSRASGPPDEVRTSRQCLSEWRMLWQDRLAALQANGALRKDADAREAGTAAVALIIGIAVQLLVRPKSGNRRIADTFDSFLRSLVD
jgi:AcrR family transcriptional regulator